MRRAAPLDAATLLIDENVDRPAERVAYVADEGAHLIGRGDVPLEEDEPERLSLPQEGAFRRKKRRAGATADDYLPC